MSERAPELLAIAEIYAKGKENMEKMGWRREVAPDSSVGATLTANRRHLDSLFFQPRFFDPVEVDTALTLFGAQLRAPIFCSALSHGGHLKPEDFGTIARGVARAGSLIILGIGGTAELEAAIDAGAPTVKMVKPYRNTDLMYEKVRDAKARGCVAVGMDIDHFYGILREGRVSNTAVFGPQQSDELRHLISEAKLPFIFKGVLSVADAEKAVDLGASAIIVSTHGTASLDFAVPSSVALPRVAEAIGYRLTVLVDSGFKTGNDALKGLALGAKAVGFASSIVLAWAADGEAGVELLLNQLTAELRRTMAVTGCAELPAIDRSILVSLPPQSW